MFDTSITYHAWLLLSVVYRRTQYATNLASLEKLVLYRFDNDSTGEGCLYTARTWPVQLCHCVRSLASMSSMQEAPSWSDMTRMCPTLQQSNWYVCEHTIMCNAGFCWFTFAGICIIHTNQLIPPDLSLFAHRTCACCCAHAAAVVPAESAWFAELDRHGEVVPMVETQLYKVGTYTCAYVHRHMWKYTHTHNHKCTHTYGGHIAVQAKGVHMYARVYT